MKAKYVMVKIKKANYKWQEFFVLDGHKFLLNEFRFFIDRSIWTKMWDKSIISWNKVNGLLRATDWRKVYGTIIYSLFSRN